MEAQKKFFLNLIFQTDKPRNISDFCQKKHDFYSQKQPTFSMGVFRKTRTRTGVDVEFWLLQGTRQLCDHLRCSTVF